MIITDSLVLMKSRSFLRKNFKNILLLVCLFILIYTFIHEGKKENFTMIDGISDQEKERSYQILMKDFKTIFPDGNRN